jgi:hypothetical protein
MIPFKPDLEQVPELPVLRDVLRRKMAVKVQDRLPFGVMMIQAARSPRLKKEILVDEFHGV